MKQVYSKPTLIMESFVMTQSVANECNVVPNGGSLGRPGFADKAVCGWNLGNMVLFIDSPDVNCSMDVGPNDEVFGMCYNNPNPDNAIFGS